MFNKKIASAFFIFLFAMSFGSNQMLDAVPIKVTNGHTTINSPTFSTHRWAVHRKIHFGNGLYAVRNTTWEQQSEAIREAEVPIPEQIMMISHHRFDLFSLDETQESTGHLAQLWLNEEQLLEFPRIAAIFERLDIINTGPYTGQSAYFYTIELSDGTRWIGTEREPILRHTGWKVGDEIICIGSEYQPVLINKSQIQLRDKEYHKVLRKDILRSREIKDRARNSQ